MNDSWSIGIFTRYPEVDLQQETRNLSRDSVYLGKIVGPTNKASARSTIHKSSPATSTPIPGYVVFASKTPGLCDVRAYAVVTAGGLF
jgi:hypothetical protein